MPILTTAERLGTEIDGKYAVHAVLGQGGMGVVFDATHKLTQRRVALKVLRPDLAAMGSTRDHRFMVEARVTTRIAHPNVVQVLDMGHTQDGVPYLVMEFLEGRTLKDELAARGVIEPSEMLSILLPVIGAMAVAHDHGIVHRDLKPANILLARDAIGRSVPKVLDFGVAKLVEETEITHTGAVLGTPHYLSPEQALGDSEVGTAADIWALGVIMYECLSGQVPFTGRDAGVVMRRIVNEPMPTLKAKGVSSALLAAVERAMRREPQARYSNMRELARALLLTAHSAGIALPSAPDAIGLRDWEQWRAQLAHDPQSTFDAARDSTPANDVARAAPVVARAEPSNEKPSSARRWVWLVALALLAASIGAGYRAFIASPAPVAAPLPVAVPEAMSRKAHVVPPPPSAAVVTADEAKPPPAVLAPVEAATAPAAAAPIPTPAASVSPLRNSSHRAHPRVRQDARAASATGATPAPQRSSDRMIKAW